MVIAVEWDAGGRTALGRVVMWRLQDGVWWAFVIAELEDMRRRVPAGWMDQAVLRPGSHKITTTHDRSLWWIWEPPVWPSELARFSEAAWNEVESGRASRARPDGA